jgi:copper chaperone
MGMNRETIAVTGMSCNGCEQTVESALSKIEGVSRVDANNEAETVEVVVDDNAADEDITAAIERAGFDVAT